MTRIIRKMIGGLVLAACFATPAMTQAQTYAHPVLGKELVTIVDDTLMVIEQNHLAMLFKDFEEIFDVRAIAPVGVITRDAFISLYITMTTFLEMGVCVSDDWYYAPDVHVTLTLTATGIQSVFTSRGTPGTPTLRTFLTWDEFFDPTLGDEPCE